jgi:hypothetical protein
LDVATFGGSGVLNLSKGASTALGAADILAIPGKEAALYLTGDQSLPESAINAGTGLIALGLGDLVGDALFPRGPGATPIRNWSGPVGPSIIGKYLTGKLFNLGGE